MRLLAKLGLGAGDRTRRIVIVKASADEGVDTQDREAVAVSRAIASHLGADPK